MEYCEKEPSQKHIARRSLPRLIFAAAGSRQRSGRGLDELLTRIQTQTLPLNEVGFKICFAIK